MSIEEIPAIGGQWLVIIALALAQAYNTFCTARKNAREEKQRHEQPTKTIADMVAEQAKMLDNDKRRLDDHDEQLADMKKGIMVLCAGVQGLLEHELHNGNANEMESASKDISTWLCTRP